MRRSVANNLNDLGRVRPDLLLRTCAVWLVDALSERRALKLRRVVLPPRCAIELETSVSLAVHTTRVPRPGMHAVDVMVNGDARRAGAFEVIPARR